MICLYQAGSQSEGERIRGRGTYLGENLDPRVIMYDHVMVGIEWKKGFLGLEKMKRLFSSQIQLDS